MYNIIVLILARFISIFTLLQWIINRNEQPQTFREYRQSEFKPFAVASSVWNPFGCSFCAPLALEYDLASLDQRAVPHAS